MRTDEEIIKELNNNTKERLKRIPDEEPKTRREQLRDNEKPFDEIKDDDKRFIDREPIEDQVSDEIKKTNQIKVKRDFKGIWIPSTIWTSLDLSLLEKVIIVEISSLDNADGCFATNSYFGKFFGLSNTRISQVISSLVDKDWIKSTLFYKEDSKEVEKRILRVNQDKFLKLNKTPL